MLYVIHMYSQKTYVGGVKAGVKFCRVRTTSAVDLCWISEVSKSWISH